MTHLITGVAGCIGSELAGALLARGETVRGIDDFSSGRAAHIAPLLKFEKFEFIQEDVLLCEELPELFRGADMVWHLTAKTDIKNLDPENYGFDADYVENLDATWRILQMMR